MAGQIRVNTDQVAQIATSIESLNKRLKEELLGSQEAVKALAITWEGDASQETITSYNSFAAKYFENYYEIINNYVKFLRTNIESGYFETETSNINMADAFK